MCGIGGYFGEGNNEILDRMIDSVTYRGPDDRGTIVSGKVGLGQRRLSIIDLSSGGHQPISNEEGDIHIVFNGEIYNFKSLKSELKKQHTFKGSSDTEVILHLYEEIGEEVFEKLSGMFAIAIFDERNNKLILSRDRMGKKPLYWYMKNGNFLFGSELKVLMQHPKFEKVIDTISLNKYFTYEFVPTPGTIFKDAYKLEPGSYLVWDGNNINKKIFWEPKFSPKEASFEESILELDAKLSSAVESRLVSDVPVGIFLSGGIDSSAVAYYAKKASKTNIKTFSIGFKEKSFDESQYAREVADYLKTDHYEKILSIDECVNILNEIGEVLDEPMADPSIIPTYLLSKFTREKVTVALGGDGGDELFCGYDTFFAHKFSGVYELAPESVREKVIKPLVNIIPTSFSNMSLDFKLKKFVNDFSGNKHYRNQRWLSPFSHEERSKLFNSVVWKKLSEENEFSDIDRYLSNNDSNDFFDELTLLHQRLYMMDGVLVKVDRASMMNSLEVRAPFLDKEVVDLANHMPTDFKLKGFERKYVLKELMKDKLPKEIVYRKKKGFGMPIGEWLQGELKPLLEDVLSEENIKKMNIFNYDYIRYLLDNHYSGKQDNRKQIWSVLIFALWWRKWLK
jgi:asparagine synthase (glutamine-hydrolysing)